MIKARQLSLTIAIVLTLSVGFAGCELIGDILKVGFWVGIIFVAIVVLLIGWIMRKLRGRR